MTACTVSNRPRRPGHCGSGSRACGTGPFPALLKRCGQLAAMAAVLLLTGCAVHPKGPHGPACPVIEDAAHIIEYPSERLRILKRVAARENLSTHEQIYLVDTVILVGFSSDKAQALITLIRNPCCTAETRQHIRTMLKLSRMLGRDQRHVVEALEQADHPTTLPAQTDSS
jgi:hypothetical protein